MIWAFWAGFVSFPLVVFLIGTFVDKVLGPSIDAYDRGHK